MTNTGSVPGDAVAQVYIHQRYGSASRPARQLKGFERVALQPGETKALKFPLGKDELEFWSPQNEAVDGGGRPSSTCGLEKILPPVYMPNLR